MKEVIKIIGIYYLAVALTMSPNVAIFENKTAKKLLEQTSDE